MGSSGPLIVLPRLYHIISMDIFHKTLWLAPKDLTRSALPSAWSSPCNAMLLRDVYVFIFYKPMSNPGPARGVLQSNHEPPGASSGVLQSNHEPPGIAGASSGVLQSNHEPPGASSEVHPWPAPIELIIGWMAHFQSSSSLFSHKLSAWGLHILMAVGWRFVALQSSGSNDVEHNDTTFVPSYLCTDLPT